MKVSELSGLGKSTGHRGTWYTGNKTWYTEKGSGKPFQYYCLENPYLPLKRQIDMKLEDEPPRSVGVQYATGEEWG